MAKQEITFRGKGIEELKDMDTREFAKLVKSRQRRAILKSFNEIENFVINCRKKSEKKKVIKTHLRHLVVVPKMIGYTILVYNGKQYTPVQIIIEMLGHRLGEFSITRHKVSHGAAGIGATKSSLAKATKKK